jgi:hypothetical protein
MISRRFPLVVIGSSTGFAMTFATLSFMAIPRQSSITIQYGASRDQQRFAP